MPCRQRHAGESTLRALNGQTDRQTDAKGGCLVYFLFPRDQGVPRERIHAVSAATGRDVLPLMRSVRSVLDSLPAAGPAPETDAVNVTEAPRGRSAARIDDFTIEEDLSGPRLWFLKVVEKPIGWQRVLFCMQKREFGPCRGGPWRPAAVVSQGFGESNRMQCVLFCAQDREFGPSLATAHRIPFPITPDARAQACAGFARRPGH
jgi:hypothetical protein